MFVVIKMKSILLNMILTVFPILMYLVFSCYNVLNNKKMARVVFVITVCTSLYLGLSFENYTDEKGLLLLFCNIPVLICYFKKEGMFGFVLSLIVILVSFLVYHVNIYVVSLKYLCYFVTYILLYRKKEFNYLFIRILAIIQGFFVSFEYFMVSGNGIDKILELIFYVVSVYSLTFFCLYLFKLADNVTSLYLMVRTVSQENKLKDSLFKLTHEIKNPIAVCKGYLDMINLDNREKSQKYIGIIKSEIDRSLNVMSDFMEYSKIKVKKEIFDMVMLMDDIYDSFNILIRDKKIKFRYNNNYDELYLWGDYDRLKQVFVNILKNSIESIDSNGIIDMGVNVIDNKVIIRVIDNGEGMDEEELANVKEMFFTTKSCGTGLGVALSNEIILAHNGELCYESEKNVGTTCIVSLPI